MLQQLRHALVVSLGAIALFTSSCKKDHDPTPTPPSNATKLVKIQEGPDDYTSFTYNADGSLKTMTESYRFDNIGLSVSTLTLQYGADKKLELGTYNNGNKLRFFYENEKMVRTELADPKGVLLNISTFDYNTAGRLKTYTVFGKVLANDEVTTYKPILKTDYTYFTVHDSLVNEAVSYKRNGNTQQLEKWSVFRWSTYDEKKNPLNLLGDFAIALFRHSSRSNATDEYLYDENLVLLERTENEYTYNNSGFPISNKQKVTDPRGQTPAFYTITYMYQ
jgi:hypothetical protein